MTTPRRTFEDYNPYRYRNRYTPPPQQPAIPPSPFSISKGFNPRREGIGEYANRFKKRVFGSPTIQQEEDLRRWYESPTPEEYKGIGFLDPTQTFGEKFGTKLVPNILDLGLSFWEAGDPDTKASDLFSKKKEDEGWLEYLGQQGKNFMTPTYTPHRMKEYDPSDKSFSARLNRPVYNLFKEHLPAELTRETRETFAGKVMADELQKSLARNTALGRWLGTSGAWRALPEIVDKESLMIAATWGSGALLGLGKGIVMTPKVVSNSLYGSISSNAAKVGGNSFINKATGLVSKAGPKIPKVPKIKGVRKTATIIKSVGKAFAEPIVQNSPIKAAAAELTIDYAMEAALKAGENTAKYRTSTWGAITTGVLSTAVGAAALTQAIKGRPRKLQQVFQNQIIEGPTREGRSNIIPNAEAELNSKYMDDHTTTSIDESANIQNPHDGISQTVWSQNIHRMLTEKDIKFTRKNNRIFHAEPNEAPTTYYRYDKFEDFKKDIYDMDGELRKEHPITKKYEKEQLLDLQINKNLWDSAATVIKTSKGKHEWVVKLEDLKENISTIEQDIMPIMVDADGVGNNFEPNIDNIRANFNMIKAYLNDDPTGIHPSTQAEILRLYQNEQIIKKLLDPNNTHIWDSHIKPLIKYEREHSQKLYDRLPEREKRQIREAFADRFNVYEIHKLQRLDPVSDKTIDELIFHPFYYFEPSTAGKQVGSLGDTVEYHKFFTEKSLFDGKEIDEILDNSYMKIYALSKLFREHRLYFSRADSYAHVDDLFSKKELYYSPLESTSEYSNKYHGFAKLLDPEYGVTDNKNVTRGLEYLENIFNNKASVKGRNGIREISPHFEMPDTMLWGNKHTQYSLGNNKVTQEALDMKILIPIHGGAGYFQNVGKLPIEGAPHAPSEKGFKFNFDFAFKDEQAVELTDFAFSSPVAGLHRMPSYFGKALGSPSRNPDSKLYVGAVSPETYIQALGNPENYESVTKGYSISTGMGGDQTTQYVGHGGIISKMLRSGWKMQDAVLQVMKDNIDAQWTRYTTTEQVEGSFLDKMLYGGTTLLKLNPMSNASRFSRIFARLNIATGGKDGIPYALDAHHMENNQDILAWGRHEQWLTTRTDPDSGEPQSIFFISEIQDEKSFSTEHWDIDVQTGFGMGPIPTNEPFTSKHNINAIKDAQEFSETEMPQIIKQATADRKKYGSPLDRPLISGTPAQVLINILSMIRPRNYSKQIVDNFESNLKSIETNQEQVTLLDAHLGDWNSHNIEGYSAFKTIKEMNEKVFELDEVIEDSSISFSGGLSDAVDEDTKAFAFASLEYYIKAITAPFVSRAYRRGVSDVKIPEKQNLPIAIREIIGDMGYEKINDWKEWKAKDWILENNKNGTLSKKLLQLFEFLNEEKIARNDWMNKRVGDRIQSKRAVKGSDLTKDEVRDIYHKLAIDYQKIQKSVIKTEPTGNYSILDEFGNVGLSKITTAGQPIRAKFTVNAIVDQVMPVIKLDELMKYFDTPVDKEAYDYYTMRFRAQNYSPKSNYTNEPRRIYLQLKHYIEKAIKQGDTWIGFPTSTEIIRRNNIIDFSEIHGPRYESNNHKRKVIAKLYNETIPNTIKLIMKQQYGIDIKIDKSDLPSTLDASANSIIGEGEARLLSEDTISMINDRVNILKIPKKVKDAWKNEGELGTRVHWKRVDGEAMGAVDFPVDGKISIYALNNKADIGTLTHEIGHILRRDLNDEELGVVNKYFGIKNGEWTREAEERFADIVEDYILNKKSPDPSLLAPLAKLAKLIAYIFKTHIYADLIHGKGKAKFDSLLKDITKDIPDNAASQEFLKSAEMTALTSKMAKAFNTTIEEARGSMALIQARALAWADETGGNPAEWWEKRGFDLGELDEKTLNDFKRLDTDYIDEQMLDGMPNITGGQRFNAALDKLINLVRKAPTVRAEIEAEQQARRSRAVGKGYEQVYGHGSGVDSPQKTAVRARAQLHGTGVQNSQFSPIAHYSDNGDLIPRTTDLGEGTTPLLGDELNLLFDELILQTKKGDLLFFDWLNTHEALTNILLGMAPNNYQIKLLKKAFGIEGERLGRLARRQGRSAKMLAYQVLDDVIRQSIVALKSAVDVSAILRQGFFVAIQPQRWDVTVPAYGKMWSAFLSGNRAEIFYDAIEADPLFEMFEKSGLEIILPDTMSQIDEWKRLRNPKERELASYFDTELTTGEEVFGGGSATFIKMFPVIGQAVKMSERAYSTFLNMVRFDRMKSNYLSAKRKGYIHKYDPDLRKPHVLDEEGNIVNLSDQFYTPEEKGFTEISDYEMISMADVINTITGAARMNFLYKIDPLTGRVTGVNDKTRGFNKLMSWFYWSPRLVVSRFKTILGEPLISFRGTKRLGVSPPEKLTPAWFEGFIKRTKSGKPYWAGIEMGGHSFISTAPIARLLRLSKYHNGEGFRIGTDKWGLTVPDLVIHRMVIPDYIAGLTATFGALYGLKQHFLDNDIDGYVELEPEAVDFGKVAVGATKYDVLGGHAQAARFIVNMTTGKAKSSGTLREREIHKQELITRFIRSKTHPTIGMAWSQIQGTTFTGEEFEWEKDYLDLMLSMNVEDIYELVNNSLPTQGDGIPWSQIGGNIVGGILSSSGFGAQTYFTADDVIRTYFPTTDGTRYRYKDMELYIQNLAKLFIPETKRIMGEQRSKERTIDAIMGIWLEETVGSKKGQLNTQELSKARLYLLQRMIEQDDDGDWIVVDNDVIKRATNAETGEVNAADLGYKLFQKAIEVGARFDQSKSDIYNTKWGVPPEEDEDKELTSNEQAKKEYHDIAEQARDRELAPAGYDPTIADPLRKAWEDRYAPALPKLQDEDGNFTDEAIDAIENNPSILNRYVSEEWKYTIRNSNFNPIPIGILYTIQNYGIKTDGTRSSYNKYAWEKWILPQILREEHMKTLNFTHMPSGMLNIPVQEDRKLTPNLLQQMVYYNIELNHDGTSGKGLPID